MMPMFLIEVRGEIQPRVYDKSEAAAYVGGMKRRAAYVVKHTFTKAGAKGYLKGMEIHHPEATCRLLPVVDITVDMGKGKLRSVKMPRAKARKAGRA